ncbi:MAG: TrkA family potassium uptake protein [Dehalococcoidia bacterium]
MYIIIVGCGKVGYHLARALLSAGHEVLVIEQDARRYATVVDELGSVAISGDGSEVAVLEQAGAGRSDVLVAVTGQDEDNLVACQVAKHRFTVPKTIALVNNPENEALFSNLGVDVIVSHTNAILSHVEKELPEHPLVHLLALQGADHNLVVIHIPPDAEVVGKSLESVKFPPGTMISLLVNSSGEPRLPADGGVVRANDEAIVVTTPAAEEEIMNILTRVAG